NMDSLLSFMPGLVDEIENLKNGKFKTFKFIAKREDKSFPLNSYEICCRLGEAFLDNSKILTVDVKNPDVKIRVEVRDSIYLYFNEIRGLGGLPNGVSGKGLLMLSGGIDSPVAAIMMAKRGMKLDALHFLSPPYTGDLAKDKVTKLAELIKPYSPGLSLITVSVTKILENISQYCKDSFSTILLRVFMVKIANRIALTRKCKAIITGESLSQVASQTIDGLTVSDSQRELLILRPLIGMDKSEIIDLARHYNTFETSIIQAEDCCTVFLAKHPVTKPGIKDTMLEYGKIPDTDKLIDEAIDQAQTDKMN
ncbi:MAG: tRNA 4-thiouridine(8) synthase ThiI, partial [Spirochaetes bacterium]|nr:tRNA 4-thiouridine(8) synthase ThiI [Spirochaetota bacterium]